ncbi:hypothetical protein GR268_47605, partial [Rhizobium leguminosarum]|nr:hypothetical protein [Rhizobium leguminosarum]
SNNIQKRTILRFASFAQHNKIGSINLQDEQGCTPLHEAAENGHTEIIALLFQAGGDIYIKNRNGATPLHKAFDNVQPEVVQFILEQDKLFPLHWAVENGDVNLVKQLIAAGAETNSLNDYNQHALYIAFEKGYDEI